MVIRFRSFSVFFIAQVICIFLLSGCRGQCASDFEGTDTILLKGQFENFGERYRPCGGTDGECWVVGEAIVTYEDGTVVSLMETRGQQEAFVRSSWLGDNGSFDIHFWDLSGQILNPERPISEIRYRVELVDRFSGSFVAVRRTGICFEGVRVREERSVPIEQDDFILSQDRAGCDFSERQRFDADVVFEPSSECPSSGVEL